MIRPYYMGKIFKDCSGLEQCLSCNSYHKIKGICKKYNCSHCGLEFKKKDKVIRETYDYKSRRNGETYLSFSVYHVDCFLKKTVSFIDKTFMKLERRFPKKEMGRPQKYKEGSVIHQLKSLQRYHRLAGHQEQVNILEMKIQEKLNATKTKQV